MKTVGQRIVELRTAMGLTQTQFAGQLGVTRGAVGNWERDQGVKLENMALIADKCGVTLDWLGLGRGALSHDLSSAFAAAMRASTEDQARIAWLVRRAVSEAPAPAPPATTPAPMLPSGSRGTHHNDGTGDVRLALKSVRDFESRQRRGETALYPPPAEPAGRKAPSKVFRPPARKPHSPP